MSALMKHFVIFHPLMIIISLVIHPFTKNLLEDSYISSTLVLTQVVHHFNQFVFATTTSHESLYIFFPISNKIPRNELFLLLIVKCNLRFPIISIKQNVLILEEL